MFDEGTAGSGSFDISFGYTGDYTAAAHGLVPATQEAGNVVDDPANDINTALQTGEGITVHGATIPSHTAHARFSLFDAYTDGNDDLDLYVFGPIPDEGAAPFVGGSGTPTSEEEVTLSSPEPGEYLVVVHGWQTDGADASYTLFSWNVHSDPEGDEGTLSVNGPASATLGTTESVEYSWVDLELDNKYLGAVSHADADEIFDWTLVSVDTD